MDVAIDLCMKVQEVHQKNVIHNDIKGDNVIVDLIDFGNANEKGRPYRLYY